MPVLTGSIAGTIRKGQKFKGGRPAANLVQKSPSPFFRVLFFSWVWRSLPCDSKKLFFSREGKITAGVNILFALFRKRTFTAFYLNA